MKTCTLICNMESGKGITKNEINKIVKTIEKYDYGVQLYITLKSGDAKEYVKNLNEVDLVLSIGGDGTFNEIVTGNMLREKRLLISHIPVGTTNDIGNMLGLGKNLVKNVTNILEGTIKQVDLGLINGKPFAYVAGFGKFIDVTYDTPRKKKKKFGYLAYIANGVREFFQRTKMYEIEYTVNGETYHGFYSLILVSNANRIAGFNNIYRDIKLDDNKFEIVFCNISKRKYLIKTMLLILRTGITNVPGLYCYTSDKINIKFLENHKTFWTIDGEKLKDQSNNYEIKIDKSLYMLLPKKNIDKLFTK